MRDYFSFMGLKKAFSLDVEGLEKKHEIIQAQTHPDRYVNATGADQQAALQLSSYANDAYETLKDPLRRAIYLLELSESGVKALESSKASGEFLMQQIELRERLDDLNTELDCEALLQDLEKTVTDYCSDLETLFDQYDNGMSGAHYSIAEKIQEYRFINKLISETKKYRDHILVV